MSDPKTPPRAIPAWQRATPAHEAPVSSPTESATETATASTETNPSESTISTEQKRDAPELADPVATSTSNAERKQETLLQQAARFLQDPSIANSSRERKVAFLRGKGISDENVEQLLGKEEVASNAAVQSAPKSTVQVGLIDLMLV